MRDSSDDRWNQASALLRPARAGYRRDRQRAGFLYRLLTGGRKAPAKKSGAVDRALILTAIPAKAGIQCLLPQARFEQQPRHWIPAFAGMTIKSMMSIRKEIGRGRVLFTVLRYAGKKNAGEKAGALLLNLILTVIPAKAGIQCLLP